MPGASSGGVGGDALGGMSCVSLALLMWMLSDVLFWEAGGGSSAGCGGGCDGGLGGGVGGV